MKHLLFACFSAVCLLASPVQGNEIYDAVKRDLVAVDGKRVKKLKDTVRMENAQYYAIYFSAHWCPPCRKFTPKLVNFYNEMKGKYDNFDIIFVSRDKSEKAMEDYMVGANMPWPAIDFRDVSRAKEIQKYKGRGIPNLVLVDADGKVLSASYEGTNYVGPTKVMEDMKKILETRKMAAK